MIGEIIKEIDLCLSRGCYIVATMAALTLPDICGRAKYPDMEKQTKQRYIKWFDEYIGEYEKDPEDDLGMPYLSGELVYSLRCFMLHQGDVNIDNKKLDIEKFELLWEKKNKFDIYLNSSEAEISGVEGNKRAVHKTFSVNVQSLCMKLCRVASRYYKANKESFDFLKCGIVKSQY